MKKDAFSTIDGSELADVCGGFSFSLDYPGKSYWNGSGGGGGGAGDQKHGPLRESDRSIKIGWDKWGFEAHNKETYDPPTA